MVKMQKMENGKLGEFKIFPNDAVELNELLPVFFNKNDNCLYVQHKDAYDEF